jgi:hypothetical protein
MPDCKPFLSGSAVFPEIDLRGHHAVILIA